VQTIFVSSRCTRHGLEVVDFRAFMSEKCPFGSSCVDGKCGHVSQTIVAQVIHTPVHEGAELGLALQLSLLTISLNLFTSPSHLIVLLVTPLTALRSTSRSQPHCRRAARVHRAPFHNFDDRS